MELDDLKNTWKSISDAENTKTDFNDKEITKMTRQRSKSLVAKMLRNFYFELSTIPFFTAVALFAPVPDMIRYSFLLLNLVFCIFFFKPFYRFYQLLTGFNNLAQELKGYLKEQIELLANYVRWYEKINIMLIPFMDALILVGMRYLAEQKIAYTNLPTSWFGLFIIWMTMNLFMYFFIKLYIKLLYGNHLAKLQSTLTELENEN